MIKFMYNGIKISGKLYKGSYNKGVYRKESNIPENTITIYSSDYNSFPKIEGLTIENNSDSMTDYFENDKIRVFPTNKFYDEVNEAWKKQEEKRKKLIEKRRLKRVDK